MSEVTISTRIKMLSIAHGGLRGLARHLRIDVGYLSRLSSGESIAPGDEVLGKLGLRKKVIYEDATGIDDFMRGVETEGTDGRIKWGAARTHTHD